MGKTDIFIPVDPLLHLRMVREADAPVLFALIETNRAHLRRWLQWLDFTRTVEDERQSIQKMVEHYQTNGNPSCVIVYRDQIVGMIGYQSIDWINHKSEIGYWLDNHFQGHGVMTKSCRALITYGFEILGLHKIEIRCATGNTQSCAIPQRLGFAHEGVIRQAQWLYTHYVDLALYGLLISEWRQTGQQDSYKQ